MTDEVFDSASTKSVSAVELEDHAIERGLNFRGRVWRSRHLILTALLFFVAWLPYLIVMYPGAIGYDEAWSILQMMGSGSMSLTAGGEAFSGHFAVDHKPIMHTLILGFFCDLGDTVFGSQSVGVFLLVIIQSAFMAYVAAVITWYVKHLSGRTAFVVAIVFFALFPGIPLYLSSPSNDAFFTPFFCLWLLMIVIIVRSGGGALCTEVWRFG